MCVNIRGTHVIVYIYVCVCLYIYVCDQTCDNQLCEHKIFDRFFQNALSYIRNLNLSILTKRSTYLYTTEAEFNEPPFAIYRNEILYTYIENYVKISVKI